MKYTKENVEILEQFVKQTLQERTGRGFTSIQEIEGQQSIKIFRIVLPIVAAFMFLIGYVINDFTTHIFFDITQSAVLFAGCLFAILSLPQWCASYNVKNVDSVLSSLVFLDDEKFQIISDMYEDKDEVFVDREIKVDTLLNIFNAYKTYNRADVIAFS